eukprot:11505037-Alexandrium_andersonii.AAC.1
MRSTESPVALSPRGSSDPALASWRSRGGCRPTDPPASRVGYCPPSPQTAPLARAPEAFLGGSGGV